MRFAPRLRAASADLSRSTPDVVYGQEDRIYYYKYFDQNQQVNVGRERFRNRADNVG